MRSLKAALAAILTLSFLFCAAHAASAEDEEDGQYEYVCVLKDGTEVRFLSDVELSPKEVETAAGYVSRATVELCYLMEDDRYFVDGEDPTDLPFFNITGSGDYLSTDDSPPPPCPKNKHDYVVIAAVTATKHYVFDEAPKCLECRYKLFSCTKCHYCVLGFESSRRVACHSGTVVKDWEIYDNYLYYNNNDGHKQDGFVTDSVRVRVKNLINGTNDRTMFPGISQYISGFEYDGGERIATIYFGAAAASRPDYSAGDLDRYISCLKYLDALPYSEEIFPATGHDETVPEPHNEGGEEPGGTIPSDNGGNGSAVPKENLTQSDPVPSDPAPYAEGQNTGSAPTESAQSAKGGAEAQTAGTVRENGAAQSAGLHNPQTGDSLIVLIAASCFAAIVLTVTIRNTKPTRRKDK